MSLEERVVRLETKIESNFDNMGKSIGEIKEAIVILTDLQKENISQGARLEALEKSQDVIFTKLKKTEDFQYELGCPQLKHSDAVVREAVKDLDDVKSKMDTTYPICSRVVVILDSAVTKIVAPILVGIVAYWGYLTWSSK